MQPDDPRIADTLGWILCKQGRYQQALTLFQQSARKLPRNPEVQFHLGMAHYMMGQSESARQAFLVATAAPNDFSGKDEAQRKLSILGAVDGKPVELSIKDLETTLEQQPNDPVARMRLAESYEKEGAFVKAAASYEGAIKLNSNLLPATIKLAELYSGPLQSSDKALQFAGKARELAPNDPKVLAILGKAAYQSGNFAWAYSLLQESARQLPNDHEVLHDLAWAAYSLGQVEKARQTMQSVLATAPDSGQASDAKLFLDMTALARGEAASQARQADVEQVLQEDPAYVPALMARAALLEERGESKDAVKIYTEVLRRFPDFAPAQKHLALLYQGTPEKRDEAYDLAWKARKTLSEDPELAEILAKLSYERNEFAYAAQLLKQSAKKRPLDPEDLYYLGMAQFKSNDIVQARQSLDQALAAGLPDPLASEARRTVKSLDKSN